MEATQFSLETLTHGVEIAQRKEQLQQEINACDKELRSLFGGEVHPSTESSPQISRRRRSLSPAARRKISEAVKARWARTRGNTSTLRAPRAPRARKGATSRPMSAAARSRLSVMMKRRWAERRRSSRRK